MSPARYRVWPVRSSLAAGRLTLVRLTDEAVRRGCRLVTANDAPGSVYVGPLVPDEPVLAVDEVRYLGQVLALVAVPADAEVPDRVDGWSEVDGSCEMELSAAYAAPLPTIQAVRSADAVAVRQLCVEQVGSMSLVEAALTDAQHVVSGSYDFPSVRHDYLEPDWARASFDGTTLALTAPTQAPFEVRAAVAGLLGLTEAAVVVTPAPPGGSFGGRLDLLPPCQAALAAFALAAPVTMMADQREQRTYGPRSNAIAGTLRLGADRDGHLVAVHFVLDVDAGAYASYGPGVAKRLAVHAAGVYRADHVCATVRLLWTNTRPSSAFRGFGVGPLTVMLEDGMRRLAAIVGIDEIELRLANVVNTGARLSNGQLVEHPLNTTECLRRAAKFREALLQPATSGSAAGSSSAAGSGGWAADNGGSAAGSGGSRRRPAGGDHTVRGIGVALFGYGIGNTGQANPAAVRLRYDGHGSYLLMTSTVDMGQGSHTMLRRLCARTLGVPEHDVRVVVGDTSTAPNSGKTSASRTAHFVGRAVIDAARRLKARMSPDGGLDPVDGSLVVDATYSPVLGWSQRRYYPVYAVGATVAAVELDLETGLLRVESVCSVHDLGEVLDLDGALGQVVGGVAMGVSLALLPARPGEYAMIGARDMPAVQASFVVDDELGAVMLRGLGEPAVIGVGAAVHNAYRSLVETRRLGPEWKPHPVQRWRTDEGKAG